MAFAGEAKEELRAKGAEEHEITKQERRAVMAFREIQNSLPDSISRPTLAEVVEDYRKKAEVRQKSLTVTELIERKLKDMERRKLSGQHVYSTKGRLEAFEADFGDWMACDVSAEVAGDWLHDLELEPLTVNHYRAALNQLFVHGGKIKAVEENPIAAVEKLKEGPKEVGYLDLEEVAGLLTHAPVEILPAVAIGLFAGVRRAELSRMDWQEVDFEQGHIEVKANNAKSAARRLIPMREALREWLLPHAQRKGPVMPSEMIYRSRLESARTLAGIPKWPHSALRHCFASYHYAAFSNAPELAQEMGHSTTKMIFEHYRALVTPAKAKRFWEIKPEEDGKVSVIKKA